MQRSYTTCVFAQVDERHMYATRTGFAIMREHGPSTCPCNYCGDRQNDRLQYNLINANIIKYAIVRQHYKTTSPKLHW